MKIEISIEDLLIDLKRDDILNGNPFELIDGDSLYIADKFLKKVFKGIDESTIVISVIGP
jgi:hypothetical protein